MKNRRLLSSPFYLLSAAGLFCLGLISCGRKAGEQGAAVYQNPDVSFEARVSDLVSRMTLEEKIAQMMNHAPAIERLGIPEYDWWNEGLHGVARAGLATVFPQAIGLAATWDSSLMFRVATVISDEARAKHHEFVRRGKRGLYQGLTFWSPNINLFRDPRWGRGMETYGEDPYLTGRLAVEFIQGLQGTDAKYFKAVATAKHYAVHSGPEPDRHTFDAVIDERDLRQTYLPHFEAAVREGHVYSVMCAYNRFQGKACCGSDPLLAGILRNEWGFQGYVVSDCDAVDDIFRTHQIAATNTEAAALSVRSGTDLNCGRAYESLADAAKKGLITEAEIDTSVKRLFLARFKLGLFDPADRVPYALIPYSVLDSPQNRDLALEAARKSIVLLKNDGDTLPLRKDLRTVAVIGPNADDVEVLLGNYNGLPKDPVTPLRGIREKVSPMTKVLYSPGCDWSDNLPSLAVIPASVFGSTGGPDRQRGLKAEYFDNQELEGQPAFTRIDRNIQFNWWDGSPDPKLDDDDFGVRWTGTLIPPVSGVYSLGGEGFNQFKIFFQESLLVEFNGTHHSNKTYKSVKLDAGKPYELTVEFSHRSGDARMSLLWAVPGKNPAAEAVAAARQADAVVMVMGLSPRLEGEEMDVEVEGFRGGDRLTLDLPGVQERLIREIRAVGKPVILVLLNGSALAVNWAAENVPAIIEAWYPGQAAGTAIADVLFGEANPGGRLPVTFYKSAADLPPFSEYRMTNQTYRYFKGEPLFPFGFGLSYTKFRYSNLVLPEAAEAGQDITVSVDVENAGSLAGEEVVQVYLKDIEASAPVPLRSLAGFKRIRLEPGEKETVEFTLTPRQFSLIDREMKWTVEPGIFEISVGGKQPGFKGRADAATTQVLSSRLELRGARNRPSFTPS